MVVVFVRRVSVLGLFICLAATTAYSHAQTTAKIVPTRAPEVRALLVPRVESTISSDLNGRITALPLDEGQRFQQDDLLVSFDCRINQLQLKRAEAGWRGKLKTHEANLKLLKLDAVSELEVAVSKADVDVARADLELSKVQVETCEIHAPYAGRIVERHIDIHESVIPGQPLLDILDDSRLRMELYVPSHWLSWIDVGTTLDVKIDETGKDYPAVVTSLGAKVDAASQTLAVIAELMNQHDDLLSGMSGVAKFDVP